MCRLKDTVKKLFFRSFYCKLKIRKTHLWEREINENTLQQVNILFLLISNLFPDAGVSILPSLLLAVSAALHTASIVRLLWRQQGPAGCQCTSNWHLCKLCPPQGVGCGGHIHRLGSSQLGQDACHYVMAPESSGWDWPRSEPGPIPLG